MIEPAAAAAQHQENRVSARFQRIRSCAVRVREVLGMQLAPRCGPRLSGGKSIRTDSIEWVQLADNGMPAAMKGIENVEDQRANTARAWLGANTIVDESIAFAASAFRFSVAVFGQPR
ncbi:MAG TPA: hypothetical protein VKV22_04520 [Rhodanobacteraceae bacterium]|nr:hypothetical protein [Rhodanobacteraceae bacterium]